MKQWSGDNAPLLNLCLSKSPPPWVKVVMLIPPLNQGSLTFVRGQHPTEYGAITTWGRVFMKPSPKPSHTVQIGGASSQISLLKWPMMPN